MKKQIFAAIFALSISVFLFNYGDGLENTIKVQTFLAEQNSVIDDNSPLGPEVPQSYNLAKRYQYEIVDQGDKILYMDPGDSETIEITIKNTGRDSWYLGDRYENNLLLAPYFPDGRISPFLPDGAFVITDKNDQTIIENDQELTFDLNLQAPETSGVYVEGFLPFVNGIKWINNEKLSYEIVVGEDFATSYDYEISSVTGTVLPANTTQEVFIKAKNTGSVPWYGYNTFPVKFSATHDNQQVEAKLQEAVVAPGEQGTFNFEVSSGEFSENYNLEFYFEVADLFALEEKPLTWNITVSDKVVALTFDDGYGDIGDFVDALNAENVRGTFFMLGVVAENNPDDIKRIVDEGHLLANHSYLHPDFRTLSADSVRWQLEHTREIMKNITGLDVYPYFRYPYGAHSTASDNVLAEDGWEYFHWTNGTGDFNYHENSAAGRQHIYYYATLNPPDRAIVLMHIISKSTLAVLPDIIDYYRNAGYAFVTVDQL